MFLSSSAFAASSRAAVSSNRVYWNPFKYLYKPFSFRTFYLMKLILAAQTPNLASNNKYETTVIIVLGWYCTHVMPSVRFRKVNFARDRVNKVKWKVRGVRLNLHFRTFHKLSGFFLYMGGRRSGGGMFHTLLKMCVFCLGDFHGFLLDFPGRSNGSDGGLSLGRQTRIRPCFVWNGGWYMNLRPCMRR